MSRWLSLTDLIAIQQLERRGVQLDVERGALWPHSALQAALSAHWPLSPVGADTLILYTPGRRGRALGFVQISPRPRRPEADVTFIAPALDAHGDAVSIWYRLLAEATRHIGEQGGQRLFAHIAGGDGAEDVLRQSGFVVYAHEDVYHLTDRPGNLSKSNLLRHQRSRDAWNLLRLYSQTTPRPVQNAEGMLTPEGQEGRMRDWWDQTRGTGYVLAVDRELVGAVRVLRGPSAYWLRFWLAPQADAYGETLLNGALSVLWAAPHRPIYVSVREYESGLRAPLQDAGFSYLYTRSLLVKHTTARIKEPLIKLVPALDQRAEPAASVAHHAEQPN